MCGPLIIPLIGFAISAASTVVGFVGQQQAADAQTARWNQNYVNALSSARDDQNALTLRQEQDGAATSQKLQLSQIDQAQRAALTTATAAQGGVGGLSVDNLLTDVARVGETNRQTAETNFQMAAQQLQSEKVATNDTAMNRINSMSPGVDPSPLAAGLDIAGAGVKGYTGYQQRML